ncbi:MAG: hypothetical protein AB1717_10890 [Pseudomonadota bacterium]
MNSAQTPFPLDALRQGQLDENQMRELLQSASEQAEPAHIVFEIADHLSHALLLAQRHAEARDVAAQALQLGQDPALLHTLALSEHALGESKTGISHLEQALQQLDGAGDDESAAMRGDMLEHLAQMQQSQAQYLRALQSLERAAALRLISGEHSEYIRCKSQLAQLAHQLGDSMQASEHWLDILALARQENLNADAARALLQLADLAKEGENVEAETSLRREAIDVLATAGMSRELARTLAQIARQENRRELMWQAVWLMFAAAQDIEGLINAHAWLFMREEQKTDRDAALLAAAVWALIENTPDERISQDPGQVARTKRLAISHLFSCARMQGIHETEITRWMELEKLRREDRVIPTMLIRIENMLKNEAWLFKGEELIQ